MLLSGGALCKHFKLNLVCRKSSTGLDTQATHWLCSIQGTRVSQSQQKACDTWKCNSEYWCDDVTQTHGDKRGSGQVHTLTAACEWGTAALRLCLAAAARTERTSRSLLFVSMQMNKVAYPKYSKQVMNNWAAVWLWLCRICQELPADSASFLNHSFSISASPARPSWLQGALPAVGQSLAPPQVEPAQFFFFVPYSIWYDSV